MRDEYDFSKAKCNPHAARLKRRVTIRREDDISAESLLFGQPSAESCQRFTAMIRQEGDWWLGWIEEVPGVNCQERSHEELMDTLEVTLREALELH